MPHLRPLENHEVDQELREMFEHYENTRGFCPNSVKTMARRPNISKTFGKLNQVILYEGTVSEELNVSRFSIEPSFWLSLLPIPHDQSIQYL